MVFRIVNRPLMALFASIGLFLLFPFLLRLLLRLSHAVDLLPQCFQLILGLGIVSRPKRLLQLVNPFLNLRTLGLQRLRAQGHALIPGLLLGFQLGFQLFLLLLQRLVALLKLGVIVAMHLHRRLHYAIPHLLKLPVDDAVMTSCVRAAVAAALCLAAYAAALATRSASFCFLSLSRSAFSSAVSGARLAFAVFLTAAGGGLLGGSNLPPILGRTRVGGGRRRAKQPRENLQKRFRHSQETTFLIAHLAPYFLFPITIYFVFGPTRS